MNDKDCVKLDRDDCPMCYAEVKPDFFCGAGALKE